MRQSGSAHADQRKRFIDLGNSCFVFRLSMHFGTVSSEQGHEPQQSEQREGEGRRCTKCCTKPSHPCRLYPLRATENSRKPLIPLKPPSDCHSRGREFESRRPRQHSKRVRRIQPKPSRTQKDTFSCPFLGSFKPRRFLPCAGHSNERREFADAIADLLRIRAAVTENETRPDGSVQIT